VSLGYYLLCKINCIFFSSKYFIFFISDVSFDKAIGDVILFGCGLFILFLLIGNLYTFSQLLQSLVFSQRKQLRRATSRLDTLKSEGFIQALRTEVNLMTEMVF